MSVGRFGFSMSPPSSLKMSRRRLMGAMPCLAHPSVPWRMAMHASVRSFRVSFLTPIICLSLIGRAHSRLGYACYQLGEHQEAIDAYEVRYLVESV